MSKILMLALAPMRKNKGQTVSLFVFALITALLLNIGLVLLFGIGSFFDERAEANNAPHFLSLLYSGTDSETQGRRFIENDPRVAQYEETEAVGGFGEYAINGVNVMNGILFSRVDATQKMDAPSFIGEHLPLTGDRIYIPYHIFTSGGFKIGDGISLFLSGAELNFTIAGATEAIMLGTQMHVAFRFYISAERYGELSEQLPQNGLTLLSARLHSAEDTVFFQTDHDKEVSPDGLLWSMSRDSVKQARTMIPTLIAVIITVFAIILLIVSLIVIRFRIVNGIEESMANIGVLKSAGYRSVQIVASNILQYGLIALAGGLVGVILAAATLPLIVKLFEPMIALVWNPGFDIGAALVCVVLVLLTVTLIAFITARKINKLHPLIALRGGIANHNFLKNRFPLDRSRTPLSLLLAFKQINRNMKQTVGVAVIVAAVTMAAVCGIAINYNINDGRDSFARSLFGEISMADVIFDLKDTKDSEALRKSVLESADVRKVLPFEIGTSVLFDEIKVYTYVTEDCSELESLMLVEGVYPVFDNEIAVGPAVLTVSGKGIGDTMTIRNGEHKNDCIITGVIQSAEAEGFTGMLTAGGLKQIIPEFIFSQYNIYLDDTADVEVFIEGVKQTHGDIFSNILNTQEQMDATLDSMGGMFAALAYGILAVTIFVIILTLYMIIKTSILRRRREFGIQKAVGYTTSQIMNQVALSMTPAILFGVATGTVLGCFGFNPLMTAMTGSMGLAKLDLPVPLEQIIAICAALVILAYAMSLLIAWRIRKISAYALVCE